MYSYILVFLFYLYNVLSLYIMRLIIILSNNRISNFDFHLNFIKLLLVIPIYLILLYFLRGLYSLTLIYDLILESPEDQELFLILILFSLFVWFWYKLPIV